MVWLLKLLLILALDLLPSVMTLRCFTDVDASKGKSHNCGEGTGCIKVYIDSEVHLMQLHDQLQRRGYTLEPGKLPTLPKELRGDPVLLRGCFTLKVPDRCYHATDGYSYCWCSKKDLCNSSSKISRSWTIIVFPILLALIQRLHQRT